MINRGGEGGKTERKTQSRRLRKRDAEVPCNRMTPPETKIIPDYVPDHRIGI